ncbi:MAG: WD40 repeat domain-containing protein [Gemmataceae bacterium]|nr:WD40 repeat domain-containing protein [Gemmataceae bacterium]
MKPSTRSVSCLGPALAATLMLFATARTGAGQEQPEGLMCLGEMSFRFDHSYHDFLLTPDGKHLVALGPRSVHLGELASGKYVAGWFVPIEHGLFAGITADGKEVAVYQHGKPEVIFRSLADARKNEPVTLPLAPMQSVKKVMLSPNGRLLAVVVEVATKQRRWDRLIVVGRGQGKLPLQIERTEIRGVAFSPDSKLVAMSAEQYDPVIKQRMTAVTLFEVATGKLRQELGRVSELKRKTFSFVAFSADGKRLATFERHRPGLSFWDLTTGTEIALNEKRDARKVAEMFPPEVRFRAWAAGQRLQDFSLTAGNDVYQPQTFTHDGRTLLLTSINRMPASFKLLDLATRKESPVTAIPPGATELHFVGGSTALLARSFAGTWQLWDLRAKKVVPALDGKNAEALAQEVAREKPHWFKRPDVKAELNPPNLEQAGFKKEGFDRWEKVEDAGRTPDGKVLVRRTTVWENLMGAVPRNYILHSFADAATSKPLAHLDRVSTPRSAFRFSPDSRFLAVADHDKQEVRFLEVATGKQVGVAQGLVGPLFSPNGRLAAVGHAKKGLHVIDLRTGNLLTAKTTSLADQPGVSALAFSPRGDRLAAARRDGMIFILGLSAPGKER